jgi:hypothetical protein
VLHAKEKFRIIKKMYISIHEGVGSADRPRFKWVTDVHQNLKKVSVGFQPGVVGRGPTTTEEVRLVGNASSWNINNRPTLKRQGIALFYMDSFILAKIKFGKL